ncbi:MAG: efflux RND transporter permease subunit, partial [Myxococcales bacterium]
STSSNEGVSRITVTFERDRDLDVAAVDVQNRVSLAAPRLPAEVNQAGVVVTKSQSQMLLGFALFASDDAYDETFVSNYADIHLRDALRRVRGVSDVMVRGERKFAMRLWLDPSKLAQRGLAAEDVIAAVREQNFQTAAGQLGQPPLREGQSYVFPLRLEGRLTEPAQFERIVLRRGEDGALVRLGDVARVELGAESYTQLLRIDRRPAVGLMVTQLTGSNALDVAAAVKAEVERLSKDFPPGLEYRLGFDTTLAIEESVREVVRTLFEAIALVVLVIFVFLHRLRSVLVVALILPPSLVSTFAFVALFGFSINTLTLFGLTLATGLVVDDAIVVIENISRIMNERRVSAMEAARESMGQVASAVIAISLALAAVFVPVAFFPGSTGTIYRQFALTIAVSMILSAVVALTLTPALSARLLGTGAWQPRFALFRRFDRGLSWLKDAYGAALTRLLHRRGLCLIAWAVAVAATVAMVRAVPTGFIPDEDQGYLIVSIQAPEGRSITETAQVIAQVEAILAEQPEVNRIFANGGFSFQGAGPNYAIIFVNLKPWGERTGPGQDLASLVERLRGPFAQIREAVVLPLQPPGIRGLGTVGGFEFVLQDTRGGRDLGALADATRLLVERAGTGQGLVGVFSAFNTDTPLLALDVDRELAKALDVPLDALFSTLQVFLGGQYINDFNYADRIYRVYAQADAPYRDEPHDVGALYVRSRGGRMIPLETLVKLRPVTAAQSI